MSLQFELERTAVWRAEKAKRHSDDQRNSAAVDLLTSLAAAEANPMLVERYERLSNKISSKRWSAVHSEALGDIGFRWHPKQIDEVYSRIVAMLTNRTPMIIEMIREASEKRVARERAATAAGRPVNAV